MPKHNIDYSNTHFYRIVCRDLTVTECYVGHTTDFRVRKNAHKSQCSNATGKWFNLPVYKFIRENGGWSNWDMVLIAVHTCENKLVATMKERHYIELFHASLNAVIPSRGKEERNLLRKDEIAQYQKEYYNANKETFQANKKQYNDNHQQEIIEYNHQYYQKTKDHLKEQCLCSVCGGHYSRTHRSMHEKTKKHQEAILS